MNNAERLVVLGLSLLFLAACEEKVRGGDPAGTRKPADGDTNGALTVVVLYFDNNTKDAAYDVLQKGMADMMVTDLSAIDRVQVVERQKLDQLIAELNLQKTSYFDPATAQKIGRGAGARFAVTGSIAALDPELRLDVRLIEVPTGNVVFADKVVGSRKKFFDLQQQLVTKFATGLSLKLAAPPTQTRVDDIDTLLTYSRGLDAADNGDLEAASKEMADAAANAPGFQLATTRLAEFSKRLEASQKRRQVLLSTSKMDLLKSADEQLRKPGPESSKKAEAAAFLGYRLLRGELILARLREAAGISSPFMPPPVLQAATLDDANELARAYYENQFKFVTELTNFLGTQQVRTVHVEVSADDMKKAKALGLDSFKFGSMLFAKPSDVGVQTAKLILGGFSPSLGASDPAYARRAFALYDVALREAQFLPEAQREDAVVDILDAFAESASSIGMRDLAMSKWQEILDGHATSSKFPALEKKIQIALGTTAAQKTYRKALEACDTSIVGASVVARMERQSLVAMGYRWNVAKQMQLEIEKACSEKDSFKSTVGGSKVTILEMMLKTNVIEADLAHDCARVNELLPRIAKLTDIAPIHPNCEK